LPNYVVSSPYKILRKDLWNSGKKAGLAGDFIHARGILHSDSRRRILFRTASNVETSMMGVIPLFCTAHITFEKSMVPVPISLWVSSVPLLSWRW